MRLSLSRKSSRHEGSTLVFGFDGTANEPAQVSEYQDDTSISNVLKLHVTLGGLASEEPISTASGRAQRTFYYSGIGTRQEGESVPILGQLYSAGRRVVNRALAPTFSEPRDILDEAEADFRAAYRPGDRIVIFGFSRGAALARKFASQLLDLNGAHTVNFMGVFDTVTALGFQIANDFVVKGPLHDRVLNAVHAVAIDEDREAFAPTLIVPDSPPTTRLSEIWFAGVHGDVGGGYWQDGLSDTALACMIECAKDALGDDIAFAPQRPLENSLATQTDITVDDVALEPRFDAPIHVHDSLLQTAVMSRKLRDIQVRKPERGGGGVTSPETQPMPVLHHSVKRRIDMLPGYPPGLRNLTFRLWLEPGCLSAPIHGISGLHDYQFPRRWWRARAALGHIGAAIWPPFAARSAP